jgi:S1-C subfamily serine protease
VYLNGTGYTGYPGSGYPYGYGTVYASPYYAYGYSYPSYTYVDPSYGYGYPSTYVTPGSTAAASTVYAPSSPGPYLGIDELEVVDPAGPGMQVVRIYAGSPADQAGLQVGDVIHSANGYLTQQHGNLTWIITNAAPNGVLQLNVRTARDEVDHRIDARLR